MTNMATALFVYKFGSWDRNSGAVNSLLILARGQPIALLGNYRVSKQLGKPAEQNLIHATGCKHPSLIYCILASCYIRFTLNICYFVHQCNTFTSYFLLIVDMFRPRAAIFRFYSILSRNWCSVILPMWCCQPCASPDVVLIVSVPLLE
jgi:hypothetical protein